jgi:hypothetical protein
VVSTPSLHQCGNHRDEALGMPAAYDFVGTSDAAPIAVKEGGSTGSARRIESKYHFTWDSGHMRPNAASP